MDGLKGNALKLGSLTGEGVKLDGTINTANYSISMWVKADSLEQIAAVFYAKNGSDELHWFSCYGDSKLFNVRMTPGHYNNRVEFDSMTDVLKTGTWRMLTLAVEGTSARFYVDGVLTAQKEMKNLYEGKNPELYLGIDPLDGTFMGAYDELSIYDFALSQAEVNDLYGRVSPTVSEVSISRTELKFVKADASPENIQAALKALDINIAMKNGELPDFSETIAADWELPETISAGDSFTVTKKFTFPEGYVLPEGVNPQVSVEITVKDAELDSLEVSANPVKVKYMESETFDKTGIAVKAKYTDGTEEDVTKHIEIADESKVLAASDDKMTVQYTEGGITKTTDVAITVLTFEEAMLEARTAYFTFDNTLENAQTGGSAIEEGIAQSGENNLTYVEGRKGSALQLNSATGKGVNLNSTITTADCTISMWVKANSLGSTEQDHFPPILYGRKNNGYMMWYGVYGWDPGANANKFTIRTTRTNMPDLEFPTLTDVVENNKWKMLTLTMEGAVAKLYVDGELLSTHTLYDFFGEEPTELFLGTGPWDKTFMGAYDEVSVYNTALNAQQVKILYNQVNGN